MVRFKSIKLENYRCFKSLELDFSSSFKENLCVLVAPNGQGKTAILDSMAYLLAPFFSRLGCKTAHLKKTDYRNVMELDEDGILFRKLPQAPYMRLAATLQLDDDQDVSWDITKIRDKASQTKANVPDGIKLEQINRLADTVIERINNVGLGPIEGNEIPVFVYFNTQRSVIWKKPERRRNFSKYFGRIDAYKNALEGTLDYKDLFAWFTYIEELQRRKKEIALAYTLGERPKSLSDFFYRSLEMRTIDLAFKRMLPTFSNLRTAMNPLSLVVDVETDNIKTTCALDSQLSDGYKNVIVLVLTLVHRMLEANGVQAKEDPQAVLDTEGIVLIDEVDLFLHPSWQQRILRDLRTTFPRIQFIVSTHSPQVVASVPKECIRLITSDHARELTHPTQGVEVAGILNAVFGTPETDQNLKIVADLEHLKALTCEGKGDSQEWQELYRELVTYYGENYGPLKGILLHKDFLKSLKKVAHNA